LSYDQVAARLGITRNAVKNHMVLSMKILKTSVEKDLGISLGLFFLILYGA
jgi:RNA polymerase sigma-70 factor (ECF subfamily)